MAFCITPTNTAKMRSGLATTDNLVKVALFGGILAGRYVLPLMSKGSNTAFWNRIDQASLARLGLLTAFVGPDLLDCANTSMFTGANTWGKAGDRTLFLTDISTAVCFFIAIGGLKFEAAQSVLSRLDDVLQVGNIETIITKTSYVSWALASTFALVDAHATEKGAFFKHTCRFNLSFALVSMIFPSRSTPVALAGLAAGAVGTAHHIKTWVADDRATGG